MELSNPQLIRDMLSEVQPDRRPALPHVKKAKSLPPFYHPPMDRRRRCRCGHCSQCCEDARWERIFQEKFADPSYYSGLEVHRESPLR